MLRIGTIELDCPAVMGILNVTPDSFSDGGRFAATDAAVRRAEAMLGAGAAIIDVGGESTRPGAGSVSEQQELDRIIPVIEVICGALDVPVSVDTSKPGVMRAAVAAGAAIINDVRAFQEEGALQAAVDLQQPVCLMHMRGQPRTMQQDPDYADVVAEVTQFLSVRVAQCRAAGLGEDLIIVDPGFGFGKTTAHNVRLLADLRPLLDLGVPVLIGVSRKSTLGKITGRDVGGRLAASIAAAVLAATQGVHIIRAHDVAETVDALKIVRKVMESIDSQ